MANAFDKLPLELKKTIITQLQDRKRVYRLALERGYHSGLKAVIIGDTPGPGRPTDPNHHHTPFYSTTNSSLWVNQQLAEAGIDEKQLLWYNATLASGEELDYSHLQDVLQFDPLIIALGGNAEKWIKKAAPEAKYVKVYHPAYAKRFHSKEPYTLVDLLKGAMNQKKS